MKDQKREMEVAGRDWGSSNLLLELCLQEVLTAAFKSLYAINLPPPALMCTWVRQEPMDPALKQ